ncbi:hypothetical protein JCM8547_007552, partial [Rhodosporidiobolus lusitaniae]
GLGWIRAAILMVKTQIGLGVLGIPSVLSTFGLGPGIVLLFVVGFLTSWTAYLIGKFKLRYPQAYGMSDIGHIVGGKIGREVVSVFYWAQLASTAGGAMLGIRTAFNVWTDKGACGLIFSIVGFAIILLLSSIRTLNRISWIGWVGLVGILSSIITLAIAVSLQDRPSAAPQTGPWDPQVVSLAHPDFYNGIMALSTIIFSYAGAPNFMNVLAEMKRHEDYTKSLLLAQAITMTAYIVPGCIVYHYCGIYVASPALSSAGALLAKVCYGIALPGLVAGGVINGHMSAKWMFLRAFGKNGEIVNGNTVKAWGIWLAFVFGNCTAAWLIAEAIPVFGDLVGLIGALAATFLCLTLLIIVWFFMNWERVKTDRSPLFLLAIAFHAILLVCLAFIQVAGTYASIKILNDHIKEGQSNARRTIRECIAGAEQDDQPLGPSGAPGGMAGPRLLKSCAPCRALKVKCAGGEPCARCAKKGIECEYTERKKLGRRITNAKTKKLYELQAELDRLYTLVNHSASSTSTFTGSISEDSPQSVPDETDDDGLFSILTNPIGLLSLEDSFERFSNLNEPASLFDHVLDADPNLDPVNMKLLSEGEFEGFLTFYFDNLQRYLFLLDPALYTSRYIRRTSPFLATVIALNSAWYDSNAGHLIQPLEQHASDLAARAFTHGYKSIEVILAYSLWAPWSPVPPNPVSGKVWRNIGQSVRLAAEIRLENRLQPKLVAQYQRLLHPYPLSPALLEQSRVRTLELVFCLDVALSSQTGRMHTLSPTTSGGSAVPPAFPVAPQHFEDTPFFSRTAIENLHASNLSISRYFSKALLTHAEMRSRRAADNTGLREQFVSAWKADFAAWDREFADVRELPYLSRLNRHILLLSYSLHFPGPVEPVLAECQAVAVKASEYVRDWWAEDSRLVYASNFVLLNMSYAATFLVRQFSRKTPSPLVVERDPARVELCEQVLEILSTIGNVRPHGRSLATAYAEQLQYLLRQDASPAPSTRLYPPTFPPMPPSNPPPSQQLPFLDPFASLFPPIVPAHAASTSFTPLAPPPAAPMPAPAPSATTDSAAAVDDLALPDFSWADLPPPPVGNGQSSEFAGSAGLQQDPLGGIDGGWTSGVSDYDQLFTWLPPWQDEGTRPAQQ